MAATTLARAAPTTVPATLSREPRAAAVIAARAPPTTWVIDRAGFGFSGGVSPGGLLEGSRRSVLMSPSVFSGRGGPCVVARCPRPKTANGPGEEFVTRGDEPHRLVLLSSLRSDAGCSDPAPSSLTGTTKSVSPRTGRPGGGAGPGDRQPRTGPPNARRPASLVGDGASRWCWGAGLLGLARDRARGGGAGLDRVVTVAVARCGRSRCARCRRDRLRSRGAPW